MAIQVYCNCGNPLIVPSELGGHKVKCKICQTVLKIPEQPPGVEPSENEAEQLAQSGEYEVVGEDAIQLSCPSCGALAAPEDSACLSCGADLGGGGRGGKKFKLPSFKGGVPKSALIGVGALVVLAAVGFGVFKVYETTRPGSLTSSGFGLLADQDYDGARAAFQEALTYDPQYHQALVGMSEVAVAQDRAGEIRKFVPVALKGMDDSRRRAPLRLALARTFLEDEKYRDAYNQAVEAKNDDPNLLGVEDVRGLAMLNLDQKDEAYEVLKAAARARSQDHRVYHALAKLQREHEEWAAAESSAEQAVGLIEDDPDLWLLLSELREQLRDSEGAAAALDKVVELQPENASAHSRLSELHLASGDYDEALASAMKAEELDRNNMETAIAVGRILLAQGNAAEAQTQLRRAMKLGKSWKGEFLLGEALVMGGDAPNAMRRFQAALDQRPEDMPLHMKAARLALDAGLGADAVRWAKLVVGNEKENYDAHLLYARSLALQNRKQHDALIVAELETAIGLDPKKSQAALELGRHYLESLRPAEAIVAFDKGLLGTPSEKELLYWKGRACIRDKKWEDAVTTLERLKRLSPNYKDVDVWLRRAEEGRFYNE
jgi:tetratricopeptide (TPR) repeat protein